MCRRSLAGSRSLCLPQLPAKRHEPPQRIEHLTVQDVRVAIRERHDDQRAADNSASAMLSVIRFGFTVAFMSLSG